MVKKDKPQTHYKLYENIRDLLHAARNTIARNINVYSKSETLSRISQRTFSETDLETAIINRIEHFMLELGKGFFFAGRQVRFSFEEDEGRG
jgi:predicted nuclease of restriction endonuclease-like (RecB) superfamily